MSLGIFSVSQLLQVTLQLYVRSAASTKVSRSKFWPPVSGTGIRVSSTFSHFGYLAEGECWDAKQDSYHRITSLAVQEAP